MMPMTSDPILEARAADRLAMQDLASFLERLNEATEDGRYEILSRLLAEEFGPPGEPVPEAAMSAMGLQGFL